jgi:hypothetical protein
MSTLAVTPDVSSKHRNGSHAVDEQAAAKTLGQLIRNVQSGSLSAAQTDLASLTQQLGPSAATEEPSPLGTLLTRLGGDLRAGDLPSAQANVGSFLTTLSGDANTPAA